MSALPPKHDCPLCPRKQTFDNTARGCVSRWDSTPPGGSGQKKEAVRQPLVSIHTAKNIQGGRRRPDQQRRAAHWTAPRCAVARRGSVWRGSSCRARWVEARLCRSPLGLWPHEGAGRFGLWTSVRDTARSTHFKHYARAATAASEIRVAPHLCEGACQQFVDADG